MRTGAFFEEKCEANYGKFGFLAYLKVKNSHFEGKKSDLRVIFKVQSEANWRKIESAKRIKSELGEFFEKRKSHNLWNQAPFSLLSTRF